MQRMMRIGLVLSTLFTVATVSGAEKDQARAIVEKAIKAHGGEKAKINAQTWHVKGSMDFMGQKQPYTAIYTYALPNKFRFDLEMEMGGQKVKLIAASNGKHAWEKMGNFIRDMSKEKTLEFNHNVYSMSLTSLFPLRNKKYKLTTLGESKVGDKTVAGILVQKKGKRDVSLFFDKKTGLLAKTKTKIISEFTGKEAKQEVYFTGYQKKDGIMIFDKLTIKVDGQGFIEEEYSKHRTLKKVDPKLFSKPKK